MSELLRVTDFSLEMGNSRPVDGISFTLKQGEKVCLIGESGSGKTLTALSLLGLQPGKIISGDAVFNTPEGTKVSLFKSPQKKLHALRGKHIGYVFQEPGLSLNPSLKVGKQIAETVKTHKGVSESEALEESQKWLEKVGFTNAVDIIKRYPHELSGGQKQRIMLILAMAPEPELLIADEPTSSLDVIAQKQITNLIQKLCEEKNTALLFITHDIHAAIRLGNKIWVMKQGKISETLEKPFLFSGLQNYESERLYKSIISLGECVKTPQKEEIENEVLSVQNVSLTYVSQPLWSGKSAHYALEDVSFTLNKGEVLGIAGESGSGKSSIAKVLTGLAKPRTGNIFVSGKSLYDPFGEIDVNSRNKIRMVFQDPFSSLNPRMPIGRQMEESIVAAGFKKKSEIEGKTHVWLEKVGIPTEWKTRFPHEFSGGQRQRIAIARAMACEPEILICDECVSSLDVSLQRDILDLIHTFRSENGVSILFISHDFRAISYLCDRVMVVEKGRVTESNTIKNIVENPAEAYTKAMIEAVC